MSVTPPDEGSPEALQMRRELRHRLRRVDALTPPPAPDFAARAIAAARAVEADPEDGPPAETTPAPAPTPPPALVATSAPRTTSAPTPTPTPERRRRRRVLIGLAAAVTIGAVAVPTLRQLLDRSQTGASTSAGAAVEDSRATGAPQADVAASAVPLTSGLATGPTGSGGLTPVVDALRTSLTAAPWSATSVTLRPDPTRVEIVLPADDDPATVARALDLARGLLPAGTTIRVLAAP